MDGCHDVLQDHKFSVIVGYKRDKNGVKRSISTVKISRIACNSYMNGSMVSLYSVFTTNEPPVISYYSPLNANQIASIMANKETQTSLSPHNTRQSAHDSTSLRTMFDDGDTYDVADALESNRGSAGNKPDQSPIEEDSEIVDWDGLDDPA